MRQRFTGIAAVLILVLTSPLSHACALVTHITRAAKVSHVCCEHQALPDVCCDSSHLGCAAHTPVDPIAFPAQGTVPLVLPPQTVAVVTYDRQRRLKSSGLASCRPLQHAPPGLLVAATIVLRI